MSTQSGIGPSDSLLQTFKEFVENTDSILIAQIINETVELFDLISDSSTTSGFDTLISKLNDSDPKYILIKHDAQSSSSNVFTFVSFVPDYSAVKDKMLYASSKSNLIRQLGSEFFHHILFWNSLDEVSFNNWSSTVSNDDAKGSLSSKEKELQEIKDLQFDTLLQSTSTKKKLISHSNEFSFKFHENTEFQVESNTLYSYNLDISDEVIFLSNTTEISTPQEIIGAISSDYPQYNLVKFNGKTIFIYSCPSGSKVKERMIYASNKQGVINHLKQSIDIDKSLEVGDADELELSEFEKEQEKQSSTLENSVKFSRPTRPGRRR